MYYVWSFTAEFVMFNLQSLINPNFCLLEQRVSGANGHLATPVSSLPFGGASKGNLPKAIVCPYVEAEVDPGML